MTTLLFSGFVTLVALLTVAAIARWRGARAALVTAAALGAWLLYVGLISHLGVIRNVSMRPPGPLFLFGPLIVLFAAFVVRTCSAAGARTALAFPLWLLIGAQVFRVVVELFLRQLWLEGLVPKMLTYSGANFDIWVGASAPAIASVAARAPWGRRLALAWNIAGLLVLANVVVRAIGTTPGPLQFIPSELPDRMIGTFPYTYIPGLFVPLAVMLHALALRSTARAPAISALSPASSSSR